MPLVIPRKEVATADCATTGVKETTGDALNPEPMPVTAIEERPVTLPVPAPAEMAMPPSPLVLM